jgi:6,7-dimethyl-8-ribityllumazine synthase
VVNVPHEYQGQTSNAEGPVAIVVARYNETITSNLLRGALETLNAQGIGDAAITVAWVPGAWEVPLAALRLARSQRYRAVICLAAVIRGETTHDQYINQQVSQSLGQITLETGVPVLFGVLTCQTLEQAIHRSGGRVGNKGSECASAALEMIDLLNRLPD